MPLPRTVSPLNMSWGHSWTLQSVAPTPLEDPFLTPTHIVTGVIDSIFVHEHTFSFFCSLLFSYAKGYEEFYFC